MDPVEITQNGLVFDGAHDFFVGTAIFRFGVDQQGDQAIGLVLQQAIGVVIGAQRQAVDGEDEIAFFDVYSWFGKRRTQIVVPILARENFADPISARLIGRQFGAQQPAVDSVDTGLIAGIDINMTGVEFAAEFAEDEIEIGAVCHVFGQWFIAGAHGCPVDSCIFSS